MLAGRSIRKGDGAKLSARAAKLAAAVIDKSWSAGEGVPDAARQQWLLHEVHARFRLMRVTDEYSEKKLLDALKNRVYKARLAADGSTVPASWAPGRRTARRRKQREEQREQEAAGMGCHVSVWEQREREAAEGAEARLGCHMASVCPESHDKGTGYRVPVFCSYATAPADGGEHAPEGAHGSMAPYSSYTACDAPSAAKRGAVSTPAAPAPSPAYGYGGYGGTSCSFTSDYSSCAEDCQQDCETGRGDSTPMSCSSSHSVPSAGSVGSWCELLDAHGGFLPSCDSGSVSSYTAGAA